MRIRKNLHIKLLYLLFLTITSLKIQASGDNIRFESIASDSGLSQQTVMSIYQDSKGYMWFGTQEGLNKYDGNNFTVYQPKYNDQNAISSGWINSITEDAKGNIWVGTRNGVNILDTHTNKFTQFNSGDGGNSLNDHVVRVVHNDKNNTMWVSTRKGLNQYISSENRFKHHNFYGDGDNQNINIVAMVEDITGALWLGSAKQGLMRFDPETEKITVISNSFLTAKGEVKVSVHSLYIDEEQVLWIGTDDDGLFKLDLKKTKTSSITTDVVHVTDFTSSIILVISEDHHKTIWVGTDKGIYYKKSNDTEFNSMVGHANSDTDLANEEIWSLYSDYSGVLWVGTFDGLNKWNTHTTQFDHYRSNGKAESLSSGKISMIGSDENFIYVATRKGLDVRNKTSGEFTTLPVRTSETPGLKEAVIMSYAYVNKEEVWFGYFNQGLTKYNPLSNTYKHYAADKNNEKALGNAGVTSILATSDDTIWFGTFNGGLSKYNRETDDFTTYWHDPNDISTISSDKVLTLHESSDGNIWLGTWDAGLNIFVPSTGTAFRISHKDDNPESIGSNRVVTILEDTQNNMWIGTLGGGLNILNADRREKGKIVFDKLDSENGMPSNVVYGLLEDEQSNIWASTNKGLVKVDHETRDISVFLVSQGIQDNEFNSGAYHKDAEGYLYFGGNNGVTRFKPEDIQSNPVPPKIDFTGFQQLNKISSINSVLNEHGEIEISHTDYLIGFEFAALDFASPKDNDYMYKLEGFDKNWIDVRDSRRATYTNLPSGKYEFRVKAANSDGVWNEKGKSIVLLVNPAPWLSWWAYLIYTVMALIVVAYIVRFYRRKAILRKQYQIQLEKEVNIRTSELQEANEQLLHASITDQLTGLHNRRYLSDVIGQRLEDMNDRFGKAILDDNMDANSGPRLMALMFDLDGFKPINDNYGHDAGDKVIVQVATLLKNECREQDIVIRWGGDEYMVVAAVENLTEAKEFAERIRKSISTFAFDVGLSNKFNLSSSLGFALYPFSHYAPHSITWDQVHLLADHALYISKDAGRNTWTGIVQTDKELPFSVLNSLVPNIDKAIINEDVIIVDRSVQKSLKTG